MDWDEVINGRCEECCDDRYGISYAFFKLYSLKADLLDLWKEKEKNTRVYENTKSTRNE